MGKFYAVSPSTYFGICEEEYNMRCAIDLACMTAFFEDENYHFRESQETSKNEASSIGSVLEQYREELQGRG